MKRTPSTIKWIALWAITITLLLLGTMVSAQPGGGYAVKDGTIAGGGYQLTSAGPQAGTISAGGTYRLLVPAAPEQQGSGCCCTYLPCVLRD